MKQTLRWLLPLVVTTGILAYLFQSIGIAAVLSELSFEAAAVLFPVIVVYAAVSLLIEGLTLARLSRLAGRHTDAPTCARIKAASYTVGLLNYALGVAALSVLFKRRAGMGAQAAAGMVVTVSMLDLAMMIAVALIGAALATHTDAAPPGVLVAVVVAGLLGGLLLLRARFSLGPLDRIRDLDLFKTVRGVTWPMLAELAALRTGFVLTFIGAGMGSLYAFGVEVPIADAVVGLSLVALVGALPIAVSGLGTVQLAVTTLFGDWGETDTLVACSLAMQVTMIAVRGSLGVLFAREFTREATEATRGVET